MLHWCCTDVALMLHWRCADLVLAIPVCKRCWRCWRCDVISKPPDDYVPLFSPMQSCSELAVTPCCRLRLSRKYNALLRGRRLFVIICKHDVIKLSLLCGRRRTWANDVLAADEVTDCTVRPYGRFRGSAIRWPQRQWAACRQKTWTQKQVQKMDAILATQWGAAIVFQIFIEKF